MLPDIFKDFIESGIENNQFSEHCDLLGSLVLIKWMTFQDDKIAELSKAERKSITGFKVPHTASYHYIIKHIDDDKLLEIITDAFIKIEKSNLQYKDNVALRKNVGDFELHGKKLQWIKKDMIKNLNELNLLSDLLEHLLHAIDHLREEQFEQVENFLSNDVFEFQMKYDERSKVSFEEKRMTSFKGDIPISVNNSIIFDKTFIVEQWVRRIIMFALMTEYGSDWIKAFEDEDLEQYESMRRKLTGREVLDLKDDHLLWYANIVFLGKFFKRKDMKEIIEKVIDIKASTFAKAVFKIGEIRNEMAHNRTITKVMEEDYKQHYDVLEDAIVRFKAKTLYRVNGKTNDSFISTPHSNYNYFDYVDTLNEYEFCEYFEKLNEASYKYNGTQAYFKDEENRYVIILLPCKPLEADYLDVGVLLGRYSVFKDHIVAFYVNKLGGEYQMTISKNIGKHKMVYRSIMKIFFESVKDLGTDMPYEHQDPKYTCNPKIWFYENDYVDGLKLDIL